MPVAKDFRSSDQARDHDLRDGERIISEAVKQFGLKGGRREDFTALPGGDLRRVAVAWAVYRRTSLRNRGSQTNSDCAAVTTSRRRSENAPHGQTRHFHPKSKRG
jgi:hypothetical protein